MFRADSLLIYHLVFLFHHYKVECRLWHFPTSTPSNNDTQVLLIRYQEHCAIRKKNNKETTNKKIQIQNLHVKERERVNGTLKKKENHEVSAFLRMETMLGFFSGSGLSKENTHQENYGRQSQVIFFFDSNLFVRVRL